MNKILTISIAAYNVEKFIAQALDSIVASGKLDDIEVLIIDDGGTDNTLQLAEPYADKFPNTFFIVHKENGGYGTTVNYSIDHANGKYIKLLDGDDWFDSHNLSLLIDLLKVTEVDVVVNDYEIWRDTVSESVRKGCSIRPNRLTEIGDENWDTPIGMWAVVFRTELVRECGVKLPQNRLYTDQLFCTLPFEKAKTVLYSDYPVYCYRVGRDGQSVSKDSRIKHLDEALQNCYELADFYERSKAENNPNKQYLKTRISQYMWMGFHTILLLPVSRSAKEKTKEFDIKIRKISPELSRQMEKMKGIWGWHIKLCRITNYAAYWFVGLIPGGVKNWT